MKINTDTAKQRKKLLIRAQCLVREKTHQATNSPFLIFGLRDCAGNKPTLRAPLLSSPYKIYKYENKNRFMFLHHTNLSIKEKKEKEQNQSILLGRWFFHVCDEVLSTMSTRVESGQGRHEVRGSLDRRECGWQGDKRHLFSSAWTF
jgi:hypothetical protein